MRMITGLLNGQLLENILTDVIESCTRVRAAVAYANKDNFKLFEACERHFKPLKFYGRYDHTVPVDPLVLKWFLDRKSPNLQCKLVPDILHAKVIWWVEAGAYIGSANLSDRAWVTNIEAGVFLTHDELLNTGMEIELRRLFESIDERAHFLTKEIYKEQLRVSEARSSLINKDGALEKEFGQNRSLPRQPGLASVDRKRTDDRQYEKFSKEWNETLQLMRGIGARVAETGMRPAWVSENVPLGVQADQFLHAFYYEQVRDGNSHPFELFYSRNKLNPEFALKEAMAWWRRAEFNHDFEARTIYEWAPKIRKLFARDQLLKLSEDEFIEAFSLVHAVIDHAKKVPGAMIGLTGTVSSQDERVLKFGQWMWRQRSVEGKTVLETLHYVVWGKDGLDGEPITRRLWNGHRSPQWDIFHLGLSSLGEIVGWARPEEFPPRNGRTSKALKALGQNVRTDL